MKPAPFEYHAPTTVDEVTGLLAQFGDEVKVLAGGQSLVPMLNLRLARFEALVDVGRVASLRQVEDPDGGCRIGAMVRQCDIEESQVVADRVPLLALATPLIGHFQIRSRGTLGGSIAHADPAAEYPAVAITLDAEFEVANGESTRKVAATEFFTGTWTTTLEPEELLVAVHFPHWGPGAGFSVEEVARRHGDFAIAGATVAVNLAAVNGRGPVIDRAAIGLFGMGSTPHRAQTAELALVGTAAVDVDPSEVGRLAVAGLDPPTDLHASSELRRRIGATVVARAVSVALARAESGLDHG